MSAQRWAARPEVLRSVSEWATPELAIALDLVAGELDHHRPHAAGGDTAAANLAGCCTGDHRGTHQAPGWRYDLAPDGTLTVTTPTGLTVVTTHRPAEPSVRR